MLTRERRGKDSFTAARRVCLDTDGPISTALVDVTRSRSDRASSYRAFNQRQN